MSTYPVSLSRTRVEVRNVGGIDEATVEIPPGVSVLAGRNATNRTSFLQALMAGLGSDRVSLKGDASEGSVTLTVGDETYTRTLERTENGVVFGGDPYLDDPGVADLFAFLLENNEARRAVARGDDLREIIMRTIDTARIESDIEAAKRERDDFEARIEELDELERELPELETEREEIETELAKARETLDAKQTELDGLDAGVEESRERKQELEAAFERVRDARAELDDLEFDLETERSTIEQLEAEREEIESTLDGLDDPDDFDDPDALSGRIDELRERKRSLDETVDELGSVVNFNREMLDEEGLDLDGASDAASGANAEPTAELVVDAETTCWTCGSTVETDQIEDTLDRLRDLRSAKLEERNEVRSEIDELTDRRSTLRERRSERQRTERRLNEVEDDLETARERAADLMDQIVDQEATVEELESTAESIEVDNHDETLELHRGINGVELRIERLESDLASVVEKIDEREAAVAEREVLVDERDAVADRLADLRTRVDRIERESVDAFNEHMSTVLDILAYDNLDRIWIERREVEEREGRRKVTRTRFDLHVVRSAADGSAYEDTIEHLSESEREVTGLVFALAGYLVHDVDETVPFVLLDSLEAIDSDRIAGLVDYFRDHADHLVAALLPEDAAALDDEYAYVETID
jgi:chromosome segregation ATPase